MRRAARKGAAGKGKKKMEECWGAGAERTEDWHETKWSADL